MAQDRTRRSGVMRGIGGGASALALIAVVGVVTGCETPPSVNTVGNKDLAGTPVVVPDERVITDAEFAKRVRIGQIIEATAPGGNRIVEAELYNDTRAIQYYRHRFTWFDENGLSVHSGNTLWTDAFIQPGAAARIRSVAPSARAKDFRLELLHER